MADITEIPPELKERVESMLHNELVEFAFNEYGIRIDPAEYNLEGLRSQFYLAYSMLESSEDEIL
jgi:hypothetical protein